MLHEGIVFCQVESVLGQEVAHLTLEEQFYRLIKTLQLIEREPWEWDVAGLELEFGVGRATVERDIRILRQWGTIQRRGGSFAVKDLKFLPTGFTPSEALALVLERRPDIRGSIQARFIGGFRDEDRARIG